MITKPQYSLPLLPEEHEDFPNIGSLQLITTRGLVPSDWQQLRELRLETLSHYGDIYTNYYRAIEIETNYFWKDLCNETDGHCFFGLFILEKLVGAMRVMTWEEDPSGETALWLSAYMKAEYRSRGLARNLYLAREKWTREKGYKRAVFYILEGNQRSMAIHEKHGARYMYTSEMEWYGGPKAPWRWYEKTL